MEKPLGWMSSPRALEAAGPPAGGVGSDGDRKEGQRKSRSCRGGSLSLQKVDVERARLKL